MRRVPTVRRLKHIFVAPLVPGLEELRAVGIDMPAHVDSFRVFIVEHAGHSANAIKYNLVQMLRMIDRHVGGDTRAGVRAENVHH